MMTEPVPDPGPPPHDIPDRRFVAELFHGLAPRYDGVLLAYTLAQDLRWKDVLIRRLSPKAGDRALDLACGTGMILGRLAKFLGGSSIVGADISRSMLREMVLTGASHSIVQANAEHLPFAAQSFDLVTAGYLLKYVQLERLLPEIARVLRPGGRFGGYDFSRPIRGTPMGTLYSIYLHRILPALGHGFSRQPDSWRTVFEFLPRVAESSQWESRIEASLVLAGFVDVEVVASLGGAITWVWARKAGV